MWNSNGDLNGAELQFVDPGPIHVSGKIDGKSSVIIVSMQDITVDGRIDGTSFVYLVSKGGSITIHDRIDGNSVVVLVSTGGSITIDGKIDGSSNVTLEAAGHVTIGTQGGDGDKKIDGSSGVTADAGGNIPLGSYIDGSSKVDFSAHGSISVLGKIDGASKVRQIADVDVSVKGKIDGSSRVDLVSNRGSVTVDGKIDGDSKVSLTAFTDVEIGKQADDEDHKIDGNSSVVAVAGRNIVLGSRVAKEHTSVDFAAGEAVTIGGKISDGASVRLLAGAGLILVNGGIADSSTRVISWPKGALANPQLTGNPQWQEQEWAAVDTLPRTALGAGYWWENWSQTFGYIAPFRVVPRSLDDIATAVVGASNLNQPVKAVGGGWSFTDAALPFKTQADVDRSSLQLRGAWQRQDLRDVLSGLKDLYPTPMDLVPQAVARNVAFSTAYAQPMLRQVTNSGAQLPASFGVRLIDTRSLASSLHCEFKRIRADVGDVVGIIPAPPPRKEILFHVEAGITMGDLQQLLDHQNPRLAIQASGGSPGATLAGALSTATHGGEFTSPLLVDCVRAVHLVGPGGVQWWIEGDVPVANQAKLQKRYPKITPAHFIAAGWNGIPGLTAQDVLDAVVVSMGTMGVIYSMVIAVKPQFGLRQVVHPTSWLDLLGAAGTNEQDLRAGNAKANQALLNALMDGTVNGTGIAKADNVYVDLAINPFNRECWIVNREVTPTLPDDPNSRPPAMGDYLTALSRALSRHSVSELMGKFGGRVADFFYWGTDFVNVVKHAGAAGQLLDFVTSLPDVMAGTLAAVNVQSVVNVANWSNYPDRGHKFLGDVLTGFFHALMGTEPGPNLGSGIGHYPNSDSTGISHKVGAIGWPEGGLPGRALEIALDATNAFTFLQTVLFDDVLDKTVSAGNKPLFGYISIRVCPPTRTLMGMQQYSPYSVMIEVVAYRSPEANQVMDAIQSKAIAWAGPGPKPLLHWGLENDQVTPGFLIGTPLGQPYKAGFSRLDAFRQIRDYLKQGNPPVFDNNFTARLGL